MPAGLSKAGPSGPYPFKAPRLRQACTGVLPPTVPERHLTKATSGPATPALNRASTATHLEVEAACSWLSLPNGDSSVELFIRIDPDASVSRLVVLAQVKSASPPNTP